jgi:hypothetical protein
VLFVCIAVSASNAANIIYVDASSLNDPGAGTSEDPFRRIQDAIDYAVSGNTVQIQQGIYTGPGNCDLDPLGKSIIIRSSDPNDPDITAQTIIDPNQAGRGFYIHSGEDANCIISGLTIKNGLAGDDSGGAILCYNSNPTIYNCIIRSNIADWYGGALFCSSSSPVIIKCTITGNSAIDGGAIECWSGTTIVRNCIINNNIASNSGGAIDCYWEGCAELYNCTVVMNSSDMGGALHCVDKGKATIQNSIFWYNNANEGTQIAVESSPFSTSEVTISYSNLQGGISAVHVDPCSILNWGSGNIDIDPCFASFDFDEDPNWWDFHLKSTDGRWDPTAGPAVDLTKNGFVDLQDFAVFAVLWLQEGEGLAADFDDSNTVDLFDLKIMSDAYLTLQPRGMWVYDEVSSPCLDAGDPNSDWMAEPWPNGKRINMGTYGGTEQASKNGNVADLNVDGIVNFLDLAELGKFWGVNQKTIEDLDNNGTVDIGDLDILATNWLWEKQ